MGDNMRILLKENQRDRIEKSIVEEKLNMDLVSNKLDIDVVLKKLNSIDAKLDLVIDCFNVVATKAELGGLS